MPAQLLRPYQLAGRSRIFDAWKSGARLVLCVSPTGSGKTSLFAHIASSVVNAGKRVLVVVHRRELANQAANRFREFGVDFGYIMAGESARPYAPLQIGSVQTLVRRRCPPADLVIFDEAHLSTAKTWRTVLENYPAARVLGVTATPWRLGGKPLAGQYDECVIVSTPAELRELGFLCAYNGFSYLAPDLDDVKITAGEYNEKESGEAMGSSLVVDNMVEKWGLYARELSTVVFAANVLRSRELTDKFKGVGVTAEHLDGSTPHEQRKAILKRVETGQTMILCNVGVAVEGLDIPRLKCCILARPTKSLARAIQMMGRVRRPWEGIKARIHDHAFVIRDHGLPDAERDYSLDAKPEKPPDLNTCKECLARYTGPRCTNCSRENTEKASVERKLNTVDDAEEYTFESGGEAETARLEAIEAELLKPPVDVKWNTPGRVVEGKLLKRGSEQTDYGLRNFFLIQGSKRQYKMPGTAHLDQLMRSVQISDCIRVTYISEHALGAARSRKTFQVEIDDGT